MYFIKLIIFTILLKFLGCLGIESGNYLHKPSEQLAQSIKDAVTRTANGYLMTIVIEEGQGTGDRVQGS